jgi:hypothetical protein
LNKGIAGLLFPQFLVKGQGFPMFLVTSHFTVFRDDQSGGMPFRQATILAAKFVRLNKI